MTRRTSGAGPIILMLLVALCASGCSDTATPTDPALDLIRFQISMDGFVILAAGDTITFQGLGGELDVAQPFDLGSANGVNEVDIGIFTEPGPGLGVNGVRFATNTILTGPNLVGTTGTDVADVVTFGAEADVEASLLPAALGGGCTTPPADNVFSADSVYKMLSGRVLVSLPPGATSGSVSFGGTLCDGGATATTIFSATFVGSRL